MDNWIRKYFYFLKNKKINNNCIEGGTKPLVKAKPVHSYIDHCNNEDCLVRKNVVKIAITVLLQGVFHLLKGTPKRESKKRVGQVVNCSHDV